MIYVDWEKVLNDPPRYGTREALCSCKPEVLEEMYNFGFSKYFKTDRPKIPELGIVLKMFRSGDVNSTLDSFLINYPVPYFFFDAVGFYGLTEKSFPWWCDTSQKKLVTSSVGTGSEVLYGNIPCIVIVNRFTPNQRYSPMTEYQFLAIPKAVFQLEPGYCSAFEPSLLLQTSRP